jgi:hypothetical protein
MILRDHAYIFKEFSCFVGYASLDYWNGLIAISPQTDDRLLVLRACGLIAISPYMPTGKVNSTTAPPSL